MPRQSRSRPSAAPARSSAPAQSRGAHTQAAPRQNTGVPAQQNAGVPANMQAGQPRQPGMFANIASTAAGVAVGSTMGHGLSNMLFGGSSSVPAADQPVQQQSYEQRTMGGQCEANAKQFTQCLDATNNDMSACSFYLEQLKECQAMARAY